MAAYDEPPPGAPTPPLVARPRGKPYTQTREFGYWAVLGVFAVGALLGAGSALLTAPESGARTRRALRRNVRGRVRRLTRREKSTWARLKRTLDRAVEARREKPAEEAAEC